MDAIRFAPRRSQLTAGSVLAGFAAIACAQPDEPPVVKLEKVEVTGSNIARIEGESGLPVQLITREELQHGGMQTVQDLLERVSANQSFGGSNPALGVGSMLTGFTSASLRGLGSERTLVLLDGRRLAPYALSGGQSVDLSAIPASAIERVEILKDGASAVYGTDAIGGVINFILRKDYRGVELDANVFATDGGGGNNGRVSLTAGSGDLATDRYNAFVSASYFKQNALAATQRDSTRTGYLPDVGLYIGGPPASYPANIMQTDPQTDEVYGFDGIFNPTIPVHGDPTPASCARPYSFPAPFPPKACRFDTVSTSDAIPAAEQINVLARLTWQLDANHQLFAEGTYYRGRFTQRTSPSPVSSMFTSTQMTLPTSSPYYPTDYVDAIEGGRPDLPLELLYRPLDLGPRTDQTNVDQWNGVAGVQGNLNGWDYQLAANLTANRQVTDYLSGYLYESRFGPLLRSGVVNPFGPNDGAVLDQMRAAQVTGQANDNRASNYGAALTASNSSFRLPAGALGLAFGVEGRRERLEQTNSDFITGGDVIGGSGSVPSLAPVQRNVFSLFGEVNAPIATGTEANLALRYDHYSDFGATTNPKFTLRWQAAKNWMLRASYGTGFRAPTLSDLYQPQSLAPSFLSDPVRCPVTGSFYDCVGGIPLKEGGNPALEPETSRQANAGIVFEPMAGLSAGVDYYWVRVDNVIALVDTDTLLGPDYAAWAPGYVVRNPPDPEHPGLPGRIAYVVGYPTNVGTLTTSGIDVDLRWRGQDTAYGRFTLSLNGTYVLDYTQGGYQQANVPSGVGTRSTTTVGAIARYRQYLQLNWSHGAWGATVANNYQSGYSEPCLEDDPSGCTTRRVGSYSTWDLQARYAWPKNATFTLGIRNVLNETPPLSNQSFAFQRGLDPSYADPRGRMFYAALRYAFE